MNQKTQLMCTWSGLTFAAMFAGGWFLIAHFVPPHLPAATADEIARLYAANTSQIRLGLMFCMFATGFYAPWVAILYVILKRIEGDEAPLMAITQLVSGTVGYVVFCLPAMIWITVSFRPERDPQLLLLLNDLGWLILTMVVSPFIMQNLAIGVAVLQDRTAQALMPRWVGYFNIWAAIIYVPAGLIPFFKSGPFAWNGFIAFWLPASTFFCTIIVLTHFCRKSIRNLSYQIARLSEAD